ncbi:MAG: hypothetical protein ABIR63_05335 [Sphingomicrobium sp.]
MTKADTNRKAWTKPQIERLGLINDVAGKETVKTQAVNTKS